MESIDPVLVFPQAPIKTDIYMKPPKVPPDFVVPDLPSVADRFLKVCKLLKNLYSLKDAGKHGSNTYQMDCRNADGSNPKLTPVSPQKTV